MKSLLEDPQASIQLDRVHDLDTDQNVGCTASSSEIIVRYGIWPHVYGSLAVHIPSGGYKDMVHGRISWFIWSLSLCLWHRKQQLRPPKLNSCTALRVQVQIGNKDSWLLLWLGPSTPLVWTWTFRDTGI